MVRNHWFLWILHLNSWEQKWQDLLIFLERDFPKFRFTGESVLVRITLVLLLPWWLSWKRIPLQCRKCKRCRYNPWVGKIPWRRKWQLTPIFLPGKSHGQRSLEGYSVWGCKESYTTERLSNWPTTNTTRSEHSALMGWDSELYSADRSFSPRG